MPELTERTAKRGYLIVSAAIFVLMLGGTLPAPLYVIYQQHLHFSEIVLTLVFAVYFPGMALGLLLLGRVSNQIGRRPALLVATGIAIASTLVLIAASGLPLLFVGRFLSGFGNGMALSATTAFLAELRPGDDPGGEAAKVSAIDQMLGLGAGPALAGILAEYGLHPTLVPFYVLLALLTAVAVGLLLSPETQPDRKPVSIRPRVGVPADRRRDFASLAAIGFCTFAVIGLFTSLVPTVLQERIHNPNHAVAGAVALELFLIGAATELACRRLAPEPALLGCLGLIPFGLALLIYGVMAGSITAFAGGTAVEGVAVGLGFSAALAAVNQLAGGVERAPVLASFFMVTTCAAALPVIGIGLITRLSNGVVADITFAGVIGLLAVVTLGVRLSGLTGRDAAA